VAYNERKVLCFREKQKIAQILAQQIPDNASLFINIGTTTEAIAHALCNHKRLRVITNNLNVASIMSANEKFEVIVAGGLVRHRDQGIIGEATIDFISQFKVDYGIIGISGIDIDGTLLDFDYREVRAARAIMDNSRKVFPGADHTKFGRNAMVRLGNIVEIDCLFTDRQPPAGLPKSSPHRRSSSTSPEAAEPGSASRSREHFFFEVRLIFHLRKRFNVTFFFTCENIR
jgi:DeoR family glycerol-3-phosphate regulon repressor